ncbi:MAG: hypothetical protein V4576_00160 [Patescibacteria group bacterium]
MKNPLKYIVPTILVIIALWWGMSQGNAIQPIVYAPMHIDHSVYATTSEHVAGQTKAAKIIAIDGDKITLDYIDILSGEDAEKAKLADGHCTQKQIDEHDGCFPNGVIYDRNVNAKLRMFTIASNVELTTQFATEETPKIYFANLKSNINPSPYMVTFNDASEVVKLVEIYRP